MSGTIVASTIRSPSMNIWGQTILLFYSKNVFYHKKCTLYAYFVYTTFKNKTYHEGIRFWKIEFIEICKKISFDTFTDSALRHTLCACTVRRWGAGDGQAQLGAGRLKFLTIFILNFQKKLKISNTNWQIKSTDFEMKVKKVISRNFRGLNKTFYNLQSIFDS